MPTTGTLLLGWFDLLVIDSLMDELISIVAISSPTSGSGIDWVSSTGEAVGFAFTSNLLLNQNSSPTPPGSPPSAVPEPSTIILLGLGLAGLGFTRRRVKA